MQWEYATIRSKGRSTWRCTGRQGRREFLTLNVENHEEWTAFLHDFGEEGWTLLSASQGMIGGFPSPGTSREYIFRRRVERG